MTTVDYNGDSLSKLSLGTVQFGLDYGIANETGQPTIQKVKNIIDFVLESGINCFDTASAYGNSEKVLGEVLNKDKQSYIISKLSSDDFIQDFENNVDQSIQKLNVKSLYAILLHDSKLLSNWDKAFDGSITKLIDLKKIKYFGVSIYTEDDFNNALGNDAITFIQVPFNIFDQRAIKYNWFQRAKEKNKLIFIRSVYLQGLVFMDKDSLPANLQKAGNYLDILKSYCETLDVATGTLALSFVNSVAKESIVLFGCDSLVQAQQNIDAFNKLEYLTNSVISEIYESFKDVPEDIFNPTKW
ncbi:MAG TPA: aldo/keto reductase [Arcobacter sp.]|nr:aldo/keto reductase [Arcobacter sp.]